jgi:four helix bundle protein
MGSCNELEYDLLLARDLSFIPKATHSTLVQQVEEVRRMLTSFIQTLKP